MFTNSLRESWPAAVRMAGLLFLISICSLQLQGGPVTAAKCGGSVSQTSNPTTTCSNADVTATGTVSGTHMGVFTNVQLTHPGPYSAAAGAWIQDTITYHNQAGPGTYLVTLDFEITGTLTTSNPSVWPVIGFSFMPYESPSGGSDNWNSDGTWTGTTTHTFHSREWQFTTDQPYTWSFQLLAMQNGTSETSTYSATANFLGSAVITGGTLTDLDHQPVGGVTFTTADGTVIPINGATQTPEPAAMLLIPVGLALIAIIRKR